MRKIGSIDSRSSAQRFSDYLVTQGIESSLEPIDAAATDAAQAIWIKEEAKVAQARGLLTEFVANPQDPRYAVNAEAARLRAEQQELNRKRLRAQQSMASTVRRSSANQRPVVILVFTAICVTFGVLTNFGNPTPRVSRDGRLAPSSEAATLDHLVFRSKSDSQQSPGDPFASIKRGQIWRLLTPAFLHGNIGHLAVNMFCIFSLGAVLERIEGRRLMILMIVFTALAGTVVQALWPENNGGGPNAVGASGIGYGLFGYIWIKPLYDQRFPISIPPAFLIIGMVFLLLGIANVVQGVANGAHVGGLVGGMALAALVGRADKGKSK